MLIFTGLTGTVALFLWHHGKKRLEMIHPDLVYQMLRCVCILYVFPIGYLLVMFTVKSSYMQFEGFSQRQFIFTGYLGKIVTGLGILWVMFLIRKFIRYCKRRKKNGVRRRENLAKYSVPADDERMLAILTAVKEEIGIRAEIQLCVNELISSPMMTGIFCPKLLLPKQRYTKEQLRVIFCHECMHYRSCDVLYKILAVYIDAFFPVNTKIGTMRHLLDEWSEYYCDRRTLMQLDGEVGVREYFGTIMEVMKDETEPYSEDTVFASLGESRWRLERRIEYMAKNKEVCLVKKSVMAAAAALMLLTSVTPTYAAGASVATVNDRMRQEAEAALAREETDTELQEYEILPGQDNTYTNLVLEEPGTEAVPYLRDEVTQNFTWTVQPGTRYGSAAFYVSSGKAISIACNAVPSGQTYWLGIMNEATSQARYVSGTNGQAHDFAITDGGFYRTFVQNRGSEVMTATGTYYVFTPNATK